MTDRRHNTVSIASDERARIPFAMIGVLLLISSVLVVTTLETRAPFESETDPSLAMDRTEAASQTALRHAVLSATDDAARQPVTEPADTDFGRLLNDSANGSSDVFDNYLKVRLYLEAGERIHHAGQEVRGTTTTVSIPPATDLDSLEEAMDRVSLDSDADNGLLTVTIDGVEFTAERDGRTIASRESAITVTVGTSMYQLHERVDDFEAELNKGTFSGTGLEESGFGRQFSTELYAMGWARGYLQYGGAPVTEVVADRHIEVLANRAAFGTQEHVFGTTDPASRDVMRSAYGCLAAQDAAGLHPSVPEDRADQTCEALEFIYGGVDGGEVEPPTAGDVLDHTFDDTPGMDQEFTIGVNETADFAFVELFFQNGDDSLDEILERVYQVDVETSVSARDTGSRPSVATPAIVRENDYANWTASSSERTETTSHDVTHDEASPSGETGWQRFHTFDVAVENTHTKTTVWTYDDDGPLNDSFDEERRQRSSDTTHTVTVRIDGDHSPNAVVRDLEIDNAYEPTFGGDTLGVVANYRDVPDDAISEIVGVDPDRAASELNDSVARFSHRIDSASDIPDRLSVDSSATIHADRTLAVEEVIAAELAFMREELREENTTFEMQEMFTGNPTRELIDTIEAEKDEWIYDDPDSEFYVGDSYPSVPDKAIYEARKAYVELVIAELSDVADAHGGMQDGLEDELQDEIDGLNGGIAQLTELTESALRADQPEFEGTLPESALMNDVSFEVVGSPTYLSLETVERKNVPAVKDDVEYSSATSKNTNYFAIPYSSVASKILDNIPYLGGNDPDEVITLDTAAQMYITAVAAEELLEEEDKFREEKNIIHQEVEGEIRAEIRGRIIDELIDEFSLDEQEIEDIIEDEIESYDSIVHFGLAVSDGTVQKELPDRIAEEVTIPRGVEQPDTVVREQVRSIATVAIVDEAREIVIDDEDVRTAIRTINDEVRAEVQDKTEEALEERVDEGRNLIEEEFLEGDQSLNRVPAGLPVTPVPGYWFATANVWDIDVHGEYARFEVRANSGTPSTTGSTTYVRERGNVSVKIGGEEELFGHSEPISFESGTTLLVVVPPGGTGVGDRTGDLRRCSETWNVTGPVDDGEIKDCAA